MEVQKISVKKLKSNPNNPRQIKDENFKKLVQSIKDFPEMMDIRPIVVNKQMIILGGNMRFRAAQEAGMKEVPCIIADITEDQEQEFIIKDNVSGGEWDWDRLANEWETEKLQEWGLDLPGYVGIDVGTDGFTLPDGDKAPFQQMTFTLADEQAIVIQNAMADVKQTEEYKYTETMGNENSNGNALYLIVSQWAGQRT